MSAPQIIEEVAIFDWDRQIGARCYVDLPDGSRIEHARKESRDTFFRGRSSFGGTRTMHEAMLHEKAWAYREIAHGRRFIQFALSERAKEAVQ